MALLTIDFSGLSNLRREENMWGEGEDVRKCGTAKAWGHHLCLTDTIF